jgi:hypothetical protein
MFVRHAAVAGDFDHTQRAISSGTVGRRQLFTGCSFP